MCVTNNVLRPVPVADPIQMELPARTPEARCGRAARAAANVTAEQLAGDTQLTQAEKIAEGARMFEAMLLRQILEQTQKTVIQSKFADNSATAGIYRDMITNQLAESISKSGGLGLARTLEQQLGSQSLSPTSPADPAGSRGCETADGSLREIAPEPLRFDKRSDGPESAFPPARDAVRSRPGDRVEVLSAHRS
ncbi:MAG TPA: rod-binding protein [Verrucomicrobiae bacterium]